MIKTKTVAKVRADKAEAAPDRDKYFSRGVSKALELLEFLQIESTSLPVNEMAQRLQLSKTSTFRLLRTLETLGYVASDGRGQYKLAPDIHPVTPTQWVGKLIRAGTPHLYKLNQELTETASLAALFDNRVEVVAVIESQHVIRMSNVLGSILPPNASSLGKAITAFQPLAQRERLLRSFKIYRFTDHTITDQTDLNREYDRIQLQKFAIDREECAYDGICFSAPVIEANGHVSSAISLSMPKNRVRGSEHEEQIIRGVRTAADHLAHDLDLS